MAMELRKLEKSDFIGRKWAYDYETEGHFKVDSKKEADGWAITLARKALDAPAAKHWEEDVITPYKGDSEIHGAFVGGKEAGFMQIEFQGWNKSVRVWDMLVLREFRGKGIGRALMERCIARSRELGARRVILETQTCNLNAIAFYRAMGFELAGLDMSNYHNDDIARNEVRLEMALCLD